jgi:DNA-binding CsgD family transcriptional regulator
MRAHLDTLEALLACTTPEELRRAVSEYVKRLGFDSWVYVAKPNWQDTPPFFLSTYPAAWAAPYLEKSWIGVDPVVAHCRNHATPLTWNAARRRELNRRCPSFFHDPSDFGLKAGISVPVHGLGCQWGLLSVAEADDKDDPNDRRLTLQQVAGIQLLATFTHEAGHVFATAALSPTEVRLTARELECLRWAAEGKTGWEIGRLLSISERTVVFHVENAARKLGVYGRRQAVARAIALHLLAI